MRFRIERFALTANTVTYATTGDMLGYWDFFPTGEAGWGSVPAMGWAEVVESQHPDVPAGGRYYGWYPMARHVDMTVTPTTDGLRDDGPHHRLLDVDVLGHDTPDDALPDCSLAGEDALDRALLDRGMAGGDPADGGEAGGDGRGADAADGAPLEVEGVDDDGVE